tara:strand:+ start:180 stop:302 length:123 start_codon:yes stop_codon:yes gene_type:complete
MRLIKINYTLGVIVEAVAVTGFIIILDIKINFFKNFFYKG